MITLNVRAILLLLFFFCWYCYQALNPKLNHNLDLDQNEYYNNTIGKIYETMVILHQLAKQTYLLARITYYNDTLINNLIF